MSDDNDGKTRLVFHAPSRGLLGFGPEIATATRGTAVVHSCFLEDREYAGNVGAELEKGKLVSNELGKATLFALGKYRICDKKLWKTTVSYQQLIRDTCFVLLQCIYIIMYMNISGVFLNSNKTRIRCGLFFREFVKQGHSLRCSWWSCLSRNGCRRK